MLHAAAVLLVSLYLNSINTTKDFPTSTYVMPCSSFPRLPNSPTTGYKSLLTLNLILYFPVFPNFLLNSSPFSSSLFFFNCFPMYFISRCFPNIHLGAKCRKSAVERWLKPNVAIPWIFNSIARQPELVVSALQTCTPWIRHFVVPHAQLSPWSRRQLNSFLSVSL